MHGAIPCKLQRTKTIYNTSWIKRNVWSLDFLPYSGPFPRSTVLSSTDNPGLPLSPLCCMRDYERKNIMINWYPQGAVKIILPEFWPIAVPEMDGIFPTITTTPTTPNQCPAIRNIEYKRVHSPNVGYNWTHMNSQLENWFNSPGLDLHILFIYCSTLSFFENLRHNLFLYFVIANLNS